MNEFIEKNRRLLTFYCVAARILGWVLSILGIFAFFSLAIFLPAIIKADNGQKVLPKPNDIPSLGFKTINIMLLGLVTLGVAQFIRYLFNSLRRPGFILRQGEKILYLYSVLLFSHTVYISSISTGREFYPDVMLVLVLPNLAKVLVLIGLGQLLRRVLPMIEESKTLV